MVEKSIPGGVAKCWDVYRWPEFKALCARLGVAWELPTTRLEIILADVEEPVQIVHHYRGMEPPLEEEIEDGKVETTNMHNEKFRTLRPAHMVSGG